MIGERLRNIRDYKGLSLDDVYKSTGITNSRLSRIERGLNEHPSLDDIATLLNFYEVPLVSFLCQEGYCKKEISSLKNLEFLDEFEMKHIQDEIDFILKEKGLQNGI